MMLLIEKRPVLQRHFIKRWRAIPGGLVADCPDCPAKYVEEFKTGEGTILDGSIDVHHRVTLNDLPEEIPGEFAGMN